MKLLFSTLISTFLILSTLIAQENTSTLDTFSYLKEELDITQSEEIDKVRELVSENLRKGIFNLNFVGDANVQNSLSSGSELTANTGIGLVMDRFWLGNRNLFRQFTVSMTINVASTADSIMAEVSGNNEVLNQRDFGTYLLIPNSSKQSANLKGNLYFNDFGEEALKVTKFVSGINFDLVGSNSNWVFKDQNLNLAALALKIGIFHEFIPDKIRFNDGYSIIVGANYSSRYILGDLNFDQFSESKKSLINTDKSSFHGIEFTAKFKFRNIVAQVTLPFLAGDEVPGLTRSQFVTSIGFVGGFPLKLSDTKSNQVGNNSLGI